MSDDPPPLKDPFAIGDDERDARARRTPVPRGPAELPDPFARRPVIPVENTPAPLPARPVKRPALSDTPVARKPFTQVMPAAPAPVTQQPRHDQPTVSMPLDGSDQPTVEMPGFADLTGRELTMPATPAEGSTPALLGAEPTLLTGRELTMPATPAEGSTPAPASDLTGAEPTLLTGRELTMPATPAEGTPATAGDGGRKALHTPRTIAGFGGMAPRRTSAGKPSTGIRNSTTATSDDAWHYQGRPGPFTGQEWGDWDIGGILGEGGMGAVYRAKQKSLNRRVALKVLAPNLAADLRLLQRFQLEARTASLLQSPNVVQVFAAGEFEGNHFFVMEYVEGRDLYDVMKERAADGKPFTPDEAAGIVIQAAKGLAEAARIGVVHRDIKPPNLMVTNDGLVKVADFGIVKVMGEAVLTMTGQAVGTPSYVSPEQGRGESNIDQRSDLYSLGVVFYELLTGKKPFEGSTPNAIIYQHCYGEPVLPREINPAIDEKYQAVVLKCLQKKPENRYQNAGELIRDLEDIRSGRMLASALANYRNGTGADEAKRENMSWAQRHLLGLVATMGVVVLAGAFTTYRLIVSHGENVIIENALRDRAKSLEKTLGVIDRAEAHPLDVKALLDDYASLPYIDTERLKSWRAEVKLVGELKQALQVLNQKSADDVITLQEFRQAKANLLLYKERVGDTETWVGEWEARITYFEDLAQQAERYLAEFDREIKLDQAKVDAVEPHVKRYGALMGSDGSLITRVQQRIATFKARRERLEASLGRLDEKDVVITDAMRERMLIERDELAGMIGSQGEKITNWSAKLKSNSDRITQLRERLRVLDAPYPPVALQLKLQGEFTAFTELVDDNDADMRAWKANIAATTARIASLRTLLARLDKPAPLMVTERPEFAQHLDDLRALVGAGDEQLVEWQKKFIAAAAHQDELRAALTRLRPEQSAPLTLAEQQQLAAVREEYLALGGVSPGNLTPTDDNQYRQRLASEAAETKARVERLQAFDRREPLTAGLIADLESYARQAGESDEVLRWNAKRARVEALLAQLAPLGRAAPLPDEALPALTRLAEEIGDEAVRAWRGKVQQVTGLLTALASLDTAAPLPGDVRTQLAELAALVGDTDQRYRRWHAKVERVTVLVASLDRSFAAYGHSPAAHAQLHAEYRELTDLVSPQDPQVAAWAPRLVHLDGPPAPAWASASGRDDFGLWADLTLAPNLVQRFRFVPGGSFTMGSPEDEPGREVDETRVQVSLTRAFWLADTECTQAVWRHLAGREPARHRGDDRPVERVSWSEAQTSIAQGASRLGAPLRLPSEAEWEYAARAGGTETFSTARSDASGLAMVGWYDANAGSASKAVKLRFPNPIGLYDLHGNVWEWCQDRYAPYTTVPVSDPLGRDGETVVARGGSWGDGAAALRVANRASLKRDLRSAYVGLRLACDLVWTQDAPAPAPEPTPVQVGDPAPAPATPPSPAAEAPVSAVVPAPAATVIASAPALLATEGPVAEPVPVPAEAPVAATPVVAEPVAAAPAPVPVPADAVAPVAAESVAASAPAPVPAEAAVAADPVAAPASTQPSISADAEPAAVADPVASQSPAVDEPPAAASSVAPTIP